MTEGIRIQKVIEAEGKGFCEYHCDITNVSEERSFLQKIRLLYSEDMGKYGLSNGEYTIYRIGRHKNDMPGVFVTGRKDEALWDVCSGMTESGDKKGGEEEKAAGYKVVSDHLTLIRDDTLRVEIENDLPVDTRYTVLLPKGYTSSGSNMVQVVIPQGEPGCSSRLD